MELRTLMTPKRQVIIISLVIMAFVAIFYFSIDVGPLIPGYNTPTPTPNYFRGPKTTPIPFPTIPRIDTYVQ